MELAAFTITMQWYTSPASRRGRSIAEFHTLTPRRSPHASTMAGGPIARGGAFSTNRQARKPVTVSLDVKRRVFGRAIAILRQISRNFSV